MVRPPLHRPFIAIALVIAGAVAGIGARTVDAQELIFADGFESGDLSGWGAPVVVPTVRLAESAVAVDEAAGMVEILVAVENPNNGDVAVRWSTAGVTAIPNQDYRESSGILTIPGGQSSAVIEIEIVDWAVVEEPETFLVTISDPSNASLGQPSSCEVTIVDDDAYPDLHCEYTEQNFLEGDGTRGVYLLLSSLYPLPVTFNVTIIDGSAVAGEDFEAISGTGFINPNSNASAIPIAVLDDDIYEGSETFQVELSNPVNAVLVEPFRTVVTIEDDDPPPEISFTESALEVSEGGNSIQIEVSLSAVSGVDASVDYATVDDGANEGIDYTSTSGTLTIPAGSITGSVAVQILGDTLDEPDEDFTVALSVPVNATLVEPTVATVTIKDNDPPPEVSFVEETVTVGEGDETIVLAVELSGPSSFEVSVDFVAAGGTATGGDDYTVIDGTLTIPVGETVGTIPVGILDDLLDEIDETFSLTLSNPQSAVLEGVSTVVVTITDDDLPPEVSFSASEITVDEGTGTVTVDVELSVPSSLDITVDFTAADGTATSEADYDVLNGTLNFAAGETAASIQVSIPDDGLDENDETFTLALVNPQSAVLGDPSVVTVTISDDDVPPEVSFGVASVAVGEGEGPAVLEAILSAPSSFEVTVDYHAVNGSATAGADFEVADGTLTIAAGETLGAIEVAILDDALDEDAEDFTLSLNNPQAAVLGDPTTATITINDDDQPPQIAFADSAVNEIEGAGVVSLAVDLSSPSSFEITIDFATVGGTATAGEDFEAASGTLTIPPGEYGGIVQVTLLDDGLDENDEAFSIDLSSPQRAVAIEPSTVIVTIQDNDQPPEIFFGAPEVVVGEADGTVACAVELSAASSFGVSVDYATAADTATAGEDFASLNGTLTIQAGQTSGVVDITILDDVFDENDEVFSISLTNPQSAALGQPASTLITIADNDFPPVISFAQSEATVEEAIGLLELMVELSHVSQIDVTVDYTAVAGSASAGEDYMITSNSLVIAAGETTGIIPIQILNDEIAEYSEEFTVVLSNPQGATAGDPMVLTVIINSSDLPPVTRVAYSVGGVESVLSGSVTLTISDGVGSFDWSAAPDDLFEGQRVVYGNPSAVAYVLSCFDDSTCTMTAPGGEPPANVSEAPVIEVRNAFSSIADAVTMAGDGDHLGTHDLATARVALDIVCSASGAPDVTPVEIEGWTTSLETPITIRSRDVQRHFGVWSQSVYQLVVDGQPCIRSFVGDVVIEGLQVQSFGDSASNLAAILFEGEAAGASYLADLLIRLDDSIGTGDRLGVGVQSVGDLDLEISNTVIYDLGSGTPRHAGVMIEDDSAIVSIANSTLVGGEHGVVQTAGSATAVNTLVIGAGSSSFSGEFSAGSRNNAADDGSAPGSGGILIEGNWTVGPLAGIDTDVHLNCDPLDGATFSHTEFDTGSIADVFNDDLRIAARTAQEDTAFVQIELEEPRKLASTWVGTDFAWETRWYLEAADSVADMASRNGSYRVLVDGKLIEGFLMPDPYPIWDVMPLTMEEPARVYRLEVDRLDGDDHIYLSGWHLQWADTPCDAGADLSLDPGVRVHGDIDGEFRLAPWDVGADEAASTPPEFVRDFVEVSEAEGQVVLEVSLGRPAPAAVTVGYVTSEGSATEGVDYSGNSGAVTIPAGASIATFAIAVNDDGVPDDGEFFSVNLVNPDSGRWIGDAATVMLRDGPADVTVSFVDAAYEFAEYEGFVLLEVQLNEPAPHDVLVDWQSEDGSALMGVDFGATQGTAVIAEGASTGEVFINLLDDEVFRAGRSFFVSITDAEGAKVRAPSRTTISILDDDPPAFVFRGPQAPADEGSGVATIDVSLTLPVDQPTSVDVVAYGGSAVLGEDYVATTCTVLFDAGDTTSSCDLELIDDSLDEDDETIVVRLENPQGAVIDEPMIAWVHIQDDDPEPSISFEEAAVQVLEGSGDVSVNLILSAPSGKAIVAEWITVDGTAAAGADYVEVVASAEFEPGAVAATAAVQVLDDIEFEADEVFWLEIQDVENAMAISPTSVEITIANDDLVPEIRFQSSAVTASEGDDEVQLVLEVVPVWAEDVSVGITLNDGTAVGGVDFGAGSARVTVPAGEATVVFHVPLFDDSEVEPFETFSAALIEPDTCVVSTPGTVEVSIFDDDLVPVITLPYPGVYFSDGDVLSLDASASTVPPDYEEWFAVLLDDGSDPMALVHLSSGLTGSFTASGDDPAYRVRLVLAPTGALPDDATLRGSSPPCTYPEPGFECAGADLVVERAGNVNISGFRVAHAYPDQVMLLWSGAQQAYLERSADGGETWEDLGRPETEHFAVDTDVVEGATYFYRSRWYLSRPWTYVDSSLLPPGAPVTIPVWSAPRILPQLDGVTWHCPEPAARHFCESTLHMRLQSEPGTGDLEGSTIRVFLNEETFELTDGAGDEIHTEFNISNHYLLAFRGYDLPACVVRKSAPDLVVEVSMGQHEAVVDLDGVVFGANGLRFEVETASGDISERALLVLVMEEPVQDDPSIVYHSFRPVLFGNLVNSGDPVISGIGPTSRHSPDCIDGDSWYYFDHPAQDYNTALFFNEINFADISDRIVWTDTAGGWSSSFSGLADGAYPLQMSPPGVLYDWGMVGREISRPSGGFFTDDYATKVKTYWLGPEVEITVDSTVTDLEPHLAGIQNEILIDSADAVAMGVVRFRIADADQDLDMSSVEVSNCSLESCTSGQLGATTYPGFYSWEQKFPEGDYGWFVVELPLTTDDGGVNDLVVCASDMAGNTLGTPSEPCVSASVIRISPLVEARITDPATSPVRGKPGLIVPLDGSQSLFPDGGVALWTIGRENFWGDEWYPIATMEPSSNPSDLITRTTIPEGAGKNPRARLVVAASLDDLPDDLWPNTGDLPCVRTEGEGRCDSTQVTLVSSCTLVPDVAFVSITQPSDNLNVSSSEEFSLAASASAPQEEPFAYSWTVYAEDDIYHEWPIVTAGADDYGDGYSIDNATVETTATDLGLAEGRYLLVLRGRYPADGCQSPGWFQSQPVQIGLTIGHALSGVAPGQVVENDTFRVYSTTWLEGSDGYVFLDDDLDDDIDPVIYFGIVQPGGYLEITPLPGELPATSSTWMVSVAGDLEGSDRSIWLNALDVVDSGSSEAPLPVQNEEDESCGVKGSECTHPIIPGQTLRGEWGEPGDTDYFSFVAGAGNRYRVVLDALEEQGSESGFDVRPTDPELAVADRDKIYTLDKYSDDRGPDNPNSTLEWTTRLSGVQYIAVSTRQGIGPYRISLDLVERATPSGFEFVPYETTNHVVLVGEIDPQTGQLTEPKTTLSGHVIDPVGQPVSVAEVRWSVVDGDATLDDVSFSSSTGATVVETRLIAGDSAVVAPELVLSAGTPSKNRRRRASGESFEVSPIIGFLSESNGAVVSDTRLNRIPIGETKRLFDENSWPRSETNVPSQIIRSGKNGSDSCVEGDEFSVTKFTLPTGAKALESVAIEFVDETGAVLERLEDAIVGGTPGMVTPRVIATFSADSESPETFTEDVTGQLPVILQAILPFADAELRPVLSEDQGATWCENVATLGLSSVLYRPGNFARYLRAFEEDDDPFHYATLEILRGSVSLPAQISGANKSGSTRRLQIHFSGNLAVAPEPGFPESVEFRPPDLNVERLPRVPNAVYSGIVDSGVFFYTAPGPQFLLLDGFGNPVVEAGFRGFENGLADESVVGIVDGGNPGDSRWFGVARPDGSLNYQVIMLRATTGTLPAGQFVKTLRVQTLLGPSDHTVIIEVIDDIPITRWNCPDANEQWDCGGYSAIGTRLVQPGEGDFTKNGDPSWLRIHPVLVSEVGDSNPATPYTGIPYRVYVNGPTSGARLFSVDELGKPTANPGAELIAGGVYENASGDIEISPFGVLAAELAVETDTGRYSGESDPHKGTAVWLSRAPKQAGYYRVIAEPLAAEFVDRYSGWDRQAYSFAVSGARFLREDYSPIDYEQIESETTYWLEYIVSLDDSPPDGLVLRYEDAEGKVVTEPVIFTRTTKGLFAESHLAEIRLKPTAVPILGEAEPCTACTNFEVSATAFKLEVGSEGATPSDPLNRVLATMYGRGMVREIPLGEYRRLTYAIHKVPNGAPGAGDHPLVVEWDPAATTGNPWFSPAIDPVGASSQLTYSFGSENGVVLSRGGVDDSSYSFRNIAEDDGRVGYVRAFHVAGDVEHRFKPANPAFQTNGYGPDRVSLTIAHAGDPDSTVLLRGVLPEHIQGEVCRNASTGDKDRECGTIVKDDYEDSLGHPNVLFNLDDIILYYSDRNGFPPDVVKAQIFEESGNSSGTNLVYFQTNTYRYEPYSWDLKKFSACVEGLGNDGCVLGARRRIDQAPYTHYVIEGNGLDAAGDGIGVDVPAAFTGNIWMTIPAGTAPTDIGIDLTSMTASDPAVPVSEAYPQLYSEGLKDSPFCIDQNDSVCRNPTSAVPDYSDYAIRVCAGACAAGTEINQVAQDEHRMLVTGHDTARPADPLGDSDFQIDYDASQVLTLDLGVSPATDLTLTIRPVFDVDLTAGSHPLPTGVSDISFFLTNRVDNSLDFAEGDSINEWVHSNWNRGTNQSFLRVDSGNDDFSQNWFLLNGTKDELYDPKFDLTTAQFLLAGSFGLMQTGVDSWGGGGPEANVLGAEFDVSLAGNHLFDWIIVPSISVRVGVAKDAYHLYHRQNMQSACPENCNRTQLRLAVWNAIVGYNGFSPYANRVFGHLDLVSPDPAVWRAP